MNFKVDGRCCPWNLDCQLLSPEANDDTTKLMVIKSCLTEGACVNLYAREKDQKTQKVEVMFPLRREKMECKVGFYFFWQLDQSKPRK